MFMLLPDVIDFISIRFEKTKNKVFILEGMILPLI
jgi:hypothetical protein